MSQRWVNILCLGALLIFLNDMVENIQMLIKFPAIPKQQQMVKKSFYNMSQLASPQSWK